MEDERTEVQVWMESQEKEMDVRLSKLQSKIKTSFFPYEDADFLIDMPQIIALTHASDLQESFFRSLQENSTNLKCVAFDITDSTHLEVPESLVPRDNDRMHMTLIPLCTKLGRILASIPTIEEVIVRINDFCRALDSNALLAIIQECQRVKHLTLSLPMHHNTILPGFDSYLRGLRYLETVRIPCLSNNDRPVAIVRILMSLAVSSTLQCLKLNMCLRELTASRAYALRRVLLLETMIRIELSHMYMHTEEAADIICTAVSESNLTELCFEKCKVPPTRSVALANALILSGAAKLTVEFISRDLSFYDAFGRGLAASHRGNLEFLSIRLSYDELLAFLQHSSDFKIRGLRQSAHWYEGHFSEAVELAFAQYIVANQYLRHLTLSCHQACCFASAPILEAFCTGAGSLDTVEFFDPLNGEPFDAEWALTIQKYVSCNLNRHRRLSGHLFDACAVAATVSGRRANFAKAMAAVNASACYKFLSENEYSCRDVLLEVTLVGRDLVDSSRKRARDE
ncbi:hypothetical protein MPSEU_000220900 [Mayamaea pseudoterrestris]|nr:hypothetical protein MPSEU_000220900 [Mayamaea pseudoterrestris]